MIHFLREGDNPRPGLSVFRISDGGFSLRLCVGERWWYARVRGATNPARPRVIFDCGR